MKRGWVFISFFLLGLRAEDLRLPAESLIREKINVLDSEQYEERQNAGIQLEEWAEKFPRHLLSTLAVEYNKAPMALEIRVQLEMLLRELAGKVLFYQPKAFLGVNFELSHLPDGREVVRLENVIPGSPADRAGLRAEDAIIEVEGIGVESYDDPSDFAAQIQRQLPLESLELKVLRNKKEFRVTVILAVYKALPHVSHSRGREEDVKIREWLKKLSPSLENSEEGPVGSFRMD